MKTIKSSGKNVTTILNRNDSFGFVTGRITTEADIEPILVRALSNEGANFIEIMVPTQGQIVPFVPSWVRAARAKNLPHFYQRCPAHVPH